MPGGVLMLLLLMMTSSAAVATVTYGFCGRAFLAEEDDVIQSVERDPSRWKHLFKTYRCCC
jgi:cell division protein FtsL